VAEGPGAGCAVALWEGVGGKRPKRGKGEGTAVNPRGGWFVGGSEQKKFQDREGLSPTPAIGVRKCRWGTSHGWGPAKWGSWQKGWWVNPKMAANRTNADTHTKLGCSKSSPTVLEFLMAGD